VRAIDALVSRYFRKERVVQGGYPMEIAIRRAARGAAPTPCSGRTTACSHLIVGRDHAGVGDYYGPFDAQTIFGEIPRGSLALQPLAMDWTFYCYECGSMASMKTCPHESQAKIDDERPLPGRCASHALPGPSSGS